jgi:hypothetical protein
MTSVVPVLDWALGEDGHETASLQYRGPICGAAIGEIPEQGSDCRKVRIANDYDAPKHVVSNIKPTSGRAWSAGSEIDPTAVSADGRRVATATQTPTAAGATPSVSSELTATSRPEKVFVAPAVWLHPGRESPI